MPCWSHPVGARPCPQLSDICEAAEALCSLKLWHHHPLLPAGFPCKLSVASGKHLQLPLQICLHSDPGEDWRQLRAKNKAATLDISHIFSVCIGNNLYSYIHSGLLSPAGPLWEGNAEHIAFSNSAFSMVNFVPHQEFKITAAVLLIWCCAFK